MAAQKKLPMMMAYMRYDHAVVIEQTVLSGLTEEQAMFYFVTSFSVFLVDWAGGLVRTSASLERWRSFIGLF